MGGVDALGFPVEHGPVTFWVRDAANTQMLGFFDLKPAGGMGYRNVIHLRDAETGQERHFLLTPCNLLGKPLEQRDDE